MKALITSLLIVLLLASPAWAAPVLVPTFESIGITWSPVGGVLTNEAKVEYQPTAGGDYVRAHSLWYDNRGGAPGGEYRGSIVGLVAGTEYRVKCTLQDAPGTSETATVTTWAETAAWGIGTITKVPNQATTLTIESTDSGSAGSYHLYVPADGGGTIDVNAGADFNIIIDDNTHHIIIRGLTLKDARDEGITLGKTVSDIVIEDNEITGWATNAGDYKGAISYGWYLDACRSGATYSPLRLVIQRNYIHDPATSSQSWEFGHPSGPHGIYICDTQTNTYADIANMGNHVIRYNTITSAISGNYYNDIMGGGSNFSWLGFPGRDSDIYGNYLSHSWDECIESEGANENVRIWGNYCDKIGSGYVGIAANTVGPVYIFRNVSDESRYSTASDDSDDESGYFRGPFIKGGVGGWPNGEGRSYVYHNTILQQDAPGKTYNLGTLGISGSWGGGNTEEMVIANNILQSAWGPKSAGGARMGYAVENKANNLGDYNLTYNLFSPAINPDPHYDLHADLKDPTANEQHGSAGIPTWESGHGDETGDSGLYETTGADTKDAGVVIWGFNDLNSKWPYAGAAPDIGISETGRAAWEFGIEAYLTPVIAVQVPGGVGSGIIIQ